MVLSREELDANDMVCDFAAVKHALAEHIDRLDHAMAMNQDDPRYGEISQWCERVVTFGPRDPTTEIMARSIYDFLVTRIASGKPIEGGGRTYTLPTDLIVERVRVTETSTSWAEYGR